MARLPSRWDKEADVVCVGFGGAGAVAAVTANDLGAKVLILEKLPADTPTEVRHTPNTRSAGGAYVNIIKDKVAEASECLETLSFGATPRDICRVWAEYAAENAEWLQALGGSSSLCGKVIHGSEFPQISGHEAIEVRRFPGGGAALFELLVDNVTKRGIHVLYDTPAKELMTSEDGQVVGVLVENDGKSIAVKARKAVILTCGGFEYDEELKMNFLRCYPCYFYGNPGNAGDGIRMAQKVGAALWHMNTITGRLIHKFPGIEPAMDAGDAIKSRGVQYPFIIVDKYGKRFHKEVPWVWHAAWLEVCYFDAHRVEYPRIPCYLIFDETTRSSSRLAAPKLKGKLPNGEVQFYYVWSSDNSAEIRNGWILQGNTIEELALRIREDKENHGRMNSGTLNETLVRYNGFCSVGIDPDFGRDPRSLRPLVTPPYYAMKMYPGGPNTLGGPKLNSQAQVLDAYGKPIPRLYLAGELGSIFGFLYEGGGSIADLIVLGRIAGRNAALEKPWV